MRDGLYRICEAYYNGSLSQFDVGQLMRRSQDLTLAALAIEQLTGAVVARQAILTSGSNADASANAVNTAALLDQARKELADKEARLKTAVDKETDQKKVVEKAAADVATPPAGSNSADLQKAKDEADAQLVVDQKEVADATAAVKEQKETIAVLQSNLASANTAAKAAAKGEGKFSAPVGNGKTIDKDTAEVIAKATENIVKGILDKDQRTDACISLVSQYTNAISEKLAAASRVESAEFKLQQSQVQLLSLPGDSNAKSEVATAASNKNSASEKQKVASESVDQLEEGYKACLKVLTK